MVEIWNLIWYNMNWAFFIFHWKFVFPSCICFTKVYFCSDKNLTWRVWNFSFISCRRRDFRRKNQQKFHSFFNFIISSILLSLETWEFLLFFCLLKELLRLCFEFWKFSTCRYFTIYNEQRKKQIQMKWKPNQFSFLIIFFRHLFFFHLKFVLCFS